MSEGVTPPEPRMHGNPLSAAQHEYLFSAYTDPRRIRLRPRHLLYPLGALLVMAVGYVTVTYRSEATPFRMDTYRGLRTVHKGMSPQDVSGILGPPVSREQRGTQECFQYGKPSLKVPSFTLHTLCYEDGKLLEVQQRRYNSWVVTRDGAINPAPLEPGELDAAPEPTAPDSGPGLAGPTAP